MQEAQLEPRIGPLVPERVELWMAHDRAEILVFLLPWLCAPVFVPDSGRRAFSLGTLQRVRSMLVALLRWTISRCTLGVASFSALLDDDLDRLPFVFHEHVVDGAGGARARPRVTTPPSSARLHQGGKEQEAYDEADDLSQFHEADL